MDKIISLTSGGVDSVLLTWGLARMSPELTFLPLYYQSKLSGAYWQREHGSNVNAWKMFRELTPNVLEPQQYGGLDIKVSRGRTEYRNQIYIDATLRLFGSDPDVVGVSLGVCPGQDTGNWIHTWSLNKEDHSPDFLVAYLRARRPGWKLWTFKDFEGAIPEIGKKSERVKLGVQLLGEDWLWASTSCQRWYLGRKPGIYSYLGEGIPAVGGCGECHSCVARFVAIVCALGYDKTPYRHDPPRARWLLQYAAEYKNVDLFIRGLPYMKDGRIVTRVLGEWMERRLVSV